MHYCNGNWHRYLSASCLNYRTSRVKEKIDPVTMGKHPISRRPHCPGSYRSLRGLEILLIPTLFLLFPYIVAFPSSVSHSSAGLRSTFSQHLIMRGMSAASSVSARWPSADCERGAVECAACESARIYRRLSACFVGVLDLLQPDDRAFSLPNLSTTCTACFRILFFKHIVVCKRW